MESFSPQEIIQERAPVHAIKCGDAWNQLDEKEKLYAYYFTRACWEGSMICWFQRSYESPALFILLQIVLTQDLDKLKEKAIENGVQVEEFSQFISYAAGVYQNCGNYRSFGDTKFVPECAPEKFWKIVESSDNYSIHKGNLMTLISRRCL